MKVLKWIKTQKFKAIDWFIITLVLFCIISSVIRGLTFIVKLISR